MSSFALTRCIQGRNSIKFSAVELQGLLEAPIPGSVFVWKDPEQTKESVKSFTSSPWENRILSFIEERVSNMFKAGISIG